MLRTDRRTDGQTDRQTDGQTDGQAQTNMPPQLLRSWGHKNCLFHRAVGPLTIDDNNTNKNTAERYVKSALRLYIGNSMKASVCTYLVKIHLVVHEILSVSYFSLMFRDDRLQPY